MDALKLVILLILNTAFSQDPLIDEIRKAIKGNRIPYEKENVRPRYRSDAEYDFIVVGSGPAGSVIANRLTEVPEWNVLLLEKGPEGSILNDIPLIAIRSYNSSLSRVYDAEFEPGVCKGLVGKRCYWPAGNSVGGATLINAVMHTRGFPADYDGWARQGNPGWSYEEVLPYFLKSENISIQGLAGSEFHSTQGPLPVAYPYQSTLAKRFLQAGRELGYDTIDYSDPNTVEGFGPAYTDHLKGRKISAAQAFIFPFMSRPNLHVIKEALVTQILINPDTRKAYGIKYLKDGVERTVRSKREIISSAGSFGSPQLLMLSGIGPAEDLRRLGIPVIADLPVGKNLLEQPSTPAVLFLINTTESVTVPKSALTAPIDLIQWYASGDGKLSSNAAEAVAYLKSRYSQGYPDIELILTPSTIAADGGVFLRRALYIRDDVYYKTWGKIAFREAFSIAPIYMYPKSRGEVKLISRDPNGPLSVKGNFFSDPGDLRGAIEAVRAAIRVGETEVFRRIGARQYDRPIHGCEGFRFNSDEYWECAIRTVTIHFFHQCGTCKMGSHPGTAVVDPRLRVYGVGGLRVADASIMPDITGPHTMAPTYMIGEKAAHMIKQDWSR